MNNNDDKAQMFLFYWNILAPDTLPNPEPEYPFTQVIRRRHRFDFAFVDAKVAVEVEGNAYSVKGGGKHMQDRDLEKYNMAAEMGWLLFRFSPEMLKNNPQKCIDQVARTVKLVLDRLEKEGV